MVVAGEWYVCVNLLMDMICLLAASRLCSLRARAGRIVLSAALGTLLSMAALMIWGARAGMYAALPIAALMALLAFGVRRVPQGTLPLFMMGLLAAGTAQYLHGAGLHAYAVLTACAPVAVFASVWMVRYRSRAGERADVRLLFDQGGVTLDGMVDTGNLLRDPVTDLPVVVVGYQAVRAYMPRGMVCGRADTLPKGFRLISVRTAAGRALMMCFRPRALYVRQGSVWRAADAVVAVSGEIPGQRALLPPSLNV